MRVQLHTAVAETRKLSRQHARAIEEEHAWSRTRGDVRRRLRSAILSVARIGRIVSAQAGKFSIRRNVPRSSDTQLLSHARAIFDIVSDNIELFTEYGLPSRVLNSVQTLAAELKSAIAEQDSARRLHLILNDSIRHMLQSGDRAVLAVEVILTDAAEERPKARVDFRKARRGLPVGRTPTRPFRKRRA
ncbi:MAG TPA: hypothetical protein VEU08_14510 [Vicinamibacterales bacterium]|nr:hypothetical protein [Vicinamibacterales bacterium]